MNSVKIIQTESLTEYSVPASVITTLVALHKGGTSVLIEGSINVTGALHQGQLDYVNNSTRFPKFHATMAGDAKVYMDFADSHIESTLASLIGDGTGVTLALALAATSIGNWSNDTQLTHFTELGSFTNIHQLGINQAFTSCTNLVDIDLRNIISVGPNCFSGCTNLETVGNTSSLISASNSSFYQCQKLQSLDLSNFTQISPSLCRSCFKLQSVGDLSGVTTIGDGAFTYCYELSSVGDIKHVTGIGSRAFAHCTALEIDLELPDLNGNLNQGAFCKSGIKTISNLSLSITDIQRDYSADGGGCFLECTKLTYADLSGTRITNFSNLVFVGCTNLVTIKLPYTVTDVGYACGGCTSLQSVYLPVNTPPNVTNTSAFSGATNLTIYVPDDPDVLQAYRQDTYWGTFTIAPIPSA